ncbi:COG3650 family protein [Arenimonas sp.]|uniref:COG3650 family protein n=1 Tax=Arenimonas sp. TaxID=1872635 RepID=UPI0039E698A8
MKIATFPVVLLALLSTACQRESAPPSAAENAPAPPALLPQDAAPTSERLRGQFVIGKDGYGLTLCGEQTQRRVGLSGEAEAFVAKLVEAQAREFFVDAQGMHHTDTGLSIERFERARAEGGRCDETDQTFLFRAVGTEPFWSANAALGKLTIERPDAPAVVGDLSAPTEEGDAQRFVAQTGQGEASLLLAPTPCSDGMSDNLYGWTATLVFENREWAGCAYFGE